MQLAYLPHWYWEGTMGSPSLVPLRQLGVRIASSKTDSFSYGGMAVDYNAFKGTAARYQALLLTGSTSHTEDDMATPPG